MQICGVLIACALTPSAFADDTKTGGYDDYRDIFYAGLGAERAQSGLDNVGGAVNITAVTGVRVPTIDWIGAELGLAQTIIPGKNDNQSSGVLGKAACITVNPNVPPGCTPPAGGGGGGSSNAPSGSEGDFTMTSIALSLALRSPGRFYATGKIGYRYLVTNFTELDDKRSGVAWTAGLGWRWGQSLSGVEALYTGYAGGVKGYGLAITYGFGHH
jgi:hypothetical protein